MKINFKDNSEDAENKNTDINNENILQWSNFTITSKKGERTILSNLTGEIKSGQSLAIMGSSGAGKTTFLNYLSKKNRSSLNGLKKVSGDVKFIVNKVDQTNSFSQMSGYVTQDDILWEDLTPRELFTFAAEMRLVDKSRDEKNNIVENLINRLGLEKCADTKVGDVLSKGLSGGEKKRTAIGYELIVDPPILFLDEPTTGLDSASANNVIKLITEEARINNRIIIFTIHQPKTEIFNLFDRLFLLAEGKIMFNGSAKNAINYFSNLGYECPKNFNPSEYFIKILSMETTIVEQLDIDDIFKGKNKVINKKPDLNSSLNSKSICSFIPPTEESCLKDTLEYEQTIQNLNNKYNEVNIVSDLSSFQINNKKLENKTISFFSEFVILFKRNFLISIRNKGAFMLRFIMTVFNSLFVLLVFNSLGKGDNSVQDRNGCLYFITTSVVQANLQTNLMIFEQEKPKFYKEQENSMYGVFSYFMSKTITEIPIQIILSILVFCSTYFLAGLNSSSNDNYFYFMLTIFIAGYSGSTFAIFLASLIDKKELIPAIFPALLYTQIMAAGYLSSVKNIPYVFYPFKYISVFRYCYQALCWNEYNGYTPESLECRMPAKCKFPINDFPEDLFMSLVILGVIALSNNLLAVIALKIKVLSKKIKD